MNIYNELISIYTFSATLLFLIYVLRIFARVEQKMPHWRCWVIILTPIYNTFKVITILYKILLFIDEERIEMKKERKTRES